MDTDTASSLIAATDWLRAALLGSAATTVAEIAVAVMGMLALAGRIPTRRGVSVVLGCFVLFGAPTIAAGLVGMRGEPLSMVAPAADIASRAVPPTVPGTPLPAGPANDPYAGAAVR